MDGRNSPLNVDLPVIACDMTDARDTPEERMAEYDRLFSQALVGRDRTDDGVRLRLRAAEGIEAWIRDFSRARRPAAPSTTSRSAPPDGEVWWDISLLDGVADNDEDMARTLLDTYYYAADGVAGMTRWLAGNGFGVTANESGSTTRLDRTAR